MTQLAGNHCGICGQSILGVRDGAFCPTCESPVHVACVSSLQGASAEGRCPQCGTPLQNQVSPKGMQPEPPATSPGSIRLFRVLKTDVFIHWSWFVAALIFYQTQQGAETSFVWFAIDYLACFGIVLLHEFGHVLMCRRVGGTANRVVLWPLGGMAFVDYPPRPGAAFWTTAAGPAVNVVLAPILFLLYNVTAPMEVAARPSDLNQFLFVIAGYNLAILIFNLLPIYPLDGGQILYSVLWKILGRVRGLAVASTIGIIGGVCLGMVAILLGEVWFAVIAGFLAMSAFQGFRYSRLLKQTEGEPPTRPE